MIGITRRGLGFVAAGAALAGAGGAGFAGWGPGPAEAAEFPVSLPDKEWRKRLSSAQYTVLRKEGTERPYSSPLNDEKRAGTFTCAGCDQPVFSSKAKYDSGTGWPSFWEALPGGTGLSEDRSFGTVRTAAHCARCGGHLGHVFDDGPQPTGKRWCMNGVAMKFAPGAA